MLLNDSQIRDLCERDRPHWVTKAKWGPRAPMLHPFNNSQTTHVEGIGKVISSGLSSVGYDIRLDNTIKMYRPTLSSKVIDPKNFSESQLLEEYEIVGGAFDLPPHGYVLGCSMERFVMPSNVAAICLTKSTYARCGLLINTTPLEPGWSGFLTLEIANLTDLTIRVYTGEGIAQVMFFRHEQPDVTYRDRKGKYMDQPANPFAPL